MNIQQLKILLTNDREREQFIATACSNEHIDMTHPIIEVFKSCTRNARDAEKSQVAELIIQHFHTSLSILDIKDLFVLCPYLGKRLLKIYLPKLNKELAEDINALLELLPDDMKETFTNLLLRAIGEVCLEEMHIHICELNFMCRFKKVSGNNALALLQNAFNDSLLSALLFKKKANVGYIEHPIMPYFQQCRGANFLARRNLAVAIVTKYGKELTGGDFNYLCQQFPLDRANILSNYGYKFFAESLKVYLYQILRLQQPSKRVQYVDELLNNISLYAWQPSKIEQLSAAMLAASNFLEPSATQTLFNKYLKSNYENEHAVSAARINLPYFKTYVKILITNLSPPELLNLVAACAANTMFNSPGLVFVYLQELQKTVPNHLFLKILYTLGKTYAELSSGTRLPLPGFELIHLAVMYRDKVNDFFYLRYNAPFEHYGELRAFHQIKRESIITDPSLPKLSVFAHKKAQPALLNNLISPSQNPKNVGRC